MRGNRGYAVIAAMMAAMVAGMLGGCARHSRADMSTPGGLDQFTVDMITGSGDYPDRLHRVDVTAIELTRRCMRAAGFTWAGSATAPNPEAREGGGVSVEHVRQHGYGLSEDPPGAGPVADDTALRHALLGAQDDLLTLTSAAGTVYRYPRHGCEAQTSVVLYGDLDTAARFSFLPQEVNLRLGSRARTDPRYLAKLTQWRDCMGGAYDSPSAVVATLAETYRTDRRPLAQRRAAEITIALQDMTCNKRVRLAATKLTLRREFAQDIPPEDRAEMSRLSSLFPSVERRSTQNIRSSVTNS